MTSTPSITHEYDARFQRIEDQVTHHGRMLETHGTLLQEIHTTVLKQQAKPEFNIGASVTFVKDIMQMCAIVGVLSVWIISVVTSAGDNVTNTRISYIEKQLDAFQWKPTMEAVK